ncbi:MAG: hypothetical protein CSA36_07950 [Draconibacterium sp.]|nr:MAG: hypothetical protein CSA36_07950 [Draconibacterium sp.]
MEYNTNRKKLPLPEYGRNIQNMVDFLFTIEDKDKRNKSAQTVIDVMGNLYPYLRDVAEFNHKLWDHLAIMADFKLDIDYPYDPPTPDILTEKPRKVPYNQNSIKYRHYGHTMELLIEKAKEMEGEERDIIIEQLANQMKKLYLAWNKEAVEDEKIFEDLKELSNGEISVKEGIQLTETKAILGGKNKKKRNKRK